MTSRFMQIGEKPDDGYNMIDNAQSAIYPPLGTVYCGEVVVGTAAAQMGSIPCKLAWLRSRDANTTYIYIGSAGVTVANGTADTTTGFPLAIGEQFGPLPISNLNMLYHISGSAAQGLVYFAVS